MTDKNKAIIQSVYEKLREVLALYEKTDCYNTVPAGEKTQDISEYMENKLLDIRRASSCSEFPQLIRIVNETEHFVKSYEMPGVVTRWKQINPRLQYFDCAFDIMEECPEIYTDMRNGLTDIRLSCYPNPELVAQRNAYFARVKEQYKRKNIECSEERIFQDELLNRLTLLFEDAFKEYL